MLKATSDEFSLQLASSSATRNSKLAIQDATAREVASIDTTGTATFSKIIIAADNNGQSASVSGALSSNASTGIGVLPAGQHQVRIETRKIGTNSLIYVTPTSSTNNQVLYVSTKHTDDATTPENEGYFIISIDTPIEIPVTFNWWVIN